MQNRSEVVPFGFPEYRSLADLSREGTVVIDPPVVVERNLPGKNKGLLVLLIGFYTWDESSFNLADVHLNTGLILSVNGIPYFALDMRQLGSGQLAVANPGVGKCCLVMECDGIQTEMNISRSGLVDSELTDHFKKLAAEAIQLVENTQRHRDFRQVPAVRKDRKSAVQLRERKIELERSDQPWVYWQPTDDSRPVRLLRQPENETDTLAILWKLEALSALPFHTLETLAYSGTGADLVVHFQEDENSNPERYATMEAEYQFFNFKEHKHPIPQFPTVICWDISTKPRLSVKKTAKPYKFVVQLDDTMLRIFALSKMPGVFVATDDELKRHDATKKWTSSL